MLSKNSNIGIDELLDNDINTILVEKVSVTPKKLAGLVIKILKIIGILFITYVVIIILSIIFFTNK